MIESRGRLTIQFTMKVANFISSSIGFHNPSLIRNAQTFFLERVVNKSFHITIQSAIWEYHTTDMC